MSRRMLGLLLIPDLYLINLGLPLLPLVFKVEAADYRENDHNEQHAEYNYQNLKPRIESHLR